VITEFDLPAPKSDPLESRWVPTATSGSPKSSQTRLAAWRRRESSPSRVWPDGFYSSVVPCSAGRAGAEAAAPRSNSDIVVPKARIRGPGPNVLTCILKHL